MLRLSPNLNVMTSAVIKASKALKRDFGELEKLQVSKKSTANFVSSADRFAEKILREELSHARQAFGFICEESGVSVGSDPASNWVIDPLDGTNNFLHGVPHWAISVALEKNGETVAGVVFDPIKDEMFVAEKGFGCYLNDQRIRVSGRIVLEEAMIGTVIPTARSTPKYFEQFVKDMQIIAPKVSSINKTGSACLDLCYVAAGRYDGYFAPSLSRWDISAGALMVLEAGGYVGDLANSKNYLETGSIVAANPAMFPVLMDMLKLARTNS